MGVASAGAPRDGDRHERALVGLTSSVLGPLEVRDGDRLLPLTRAKDRLLLTTLLIHANQVVSTDRLLDVLWGDSPPASGRNALQFHISSLRNVLSPHRTGHAGMCVQTRPPGYVLEVADHDVDAGRFRRLVDDARSVLSYDPVEAHRWLTAAMSLWRGPHTGSSPTPAPPTPRSTAWKKSASRPSRCSTPRSSRSTATPMRSHDSRRSPWSTRIASGCMRC